MTHCCVDERNSLGTLAEIYQRVISSTESSLSLSQSQGGDLIIDLAENIFETIVYLSKVCDSIEKLLQIESNS